MSLTKTLPVDTSMSWRLPRKVLRQEPYPPDLPGVSEIKRLKSDAKGLADFLLHKPHIQQRLADLVDYTPNRWLLTQEIAHIRARRKIHGRRPREFNGDPYEWARENELEGICFSGGGIRSATFNLGVLQGLAKLGILNHFDYLSSVSGGGYIHEWFAAWIKREEQEQEQLAADATPPTTYSPPMGFGEVQKRLVPLPSDQDSPAHPEPIRWLRRYSNYLTPQKCLFTADTWVAIAIWFRNTFLNQLILLSFLFFLLLIPNLVAKPITKLSADWSILAAALYLFAVAWTAITLRHEYVRISPLDNYTGADEKPEEPERFGGEKTVQILVVTPLLLASVLHLSFVLRLPDHGPMSMAYLLELPFVFGLLWALVFAVAFAGASTETYRALHGLLKKPEEPGKQPEKLKEKLKILVSRFYRGVRIAVNGVGALVIGIGIRRHIVVHWGALGIGMDGNRLRLFGAVAPTDCVRPPAAFFCSAFHAGNRRGVSRPGFSRLVARMAGPSAGLGLPFRHWMGSVFRHRPVGTISGGVECDRVCTVDQDRQMDCRNFLDPHYGGVSARRQQQ